GASRPARARSAHGDRVGTLVAEVRPQPAFDLLERLAFPARVVLDLVAADASDGEVARFGMSQIEAADARTRRGRVALGEVEPGLTGSEQLEQLPLLGAAGTGGVAERGPDAAVALRNHLIVRELFARRVPGAAPLGVQPLRDRLREPIGERLDRDRPVVVMGRLEAGGKLVRSL